MAASKQERQANQLLRRTSAEIEKWVNDPADPLFGLNVMIERDDRGAFSTIHVRCRRTNVKKIKPPKTPAA